MRELVGRDKVISGFSHEQSSGGIDIRSASAGIDGVSGGIRIQTGQSTRGHSGEFRASTGSATLGLQEYTVRGGTALSDSNGGRPGALISITAGDTSSMATLVERWSSTDTAGSTQWIYPCRYVQLWQLGCIRIHFTQDRFHHGWFEWQN